MQSKNKTLATWLALVFGALGVHRFYLRGAKDIWAWLHLTASLAGAVGWHRGTQVNFENPTVFLLMSVLSLSVSAACLHGIWTGLMTPESWLRYCPNIEGVHTKTTQTFPITIMGVVLCLMLGAVALLSAIAMLSQLLFI